MRDEKFYDRVKDYIIYKTINGEYKNWDEFLGVESDDKKLEKETKIYYVSDTVKHAQYVEMFKEHGLDAVILDTMLDSSFISFIETKLENVKFESIDSNIAEALKGEGEADGFDELMTFFSELLDDKSLKVEAAHLKTADMPAVIMGSEEAKRMRDMSRMFGNMDMGGMFPDSNTLVLNTGNPVINKMAGSADNEAKKKAAKHIYELALLAAGKLDAKSIGEFVKRSGDMLEKTVGAGENPDSEENE